jgi:hypothetical protein
MGVLFHPSRVKIPSLLSVWAYNGHVRVKKPWECQ